MSARYALAAGETERFNAALTRLENVPPDQVTHEPDVLVASGRIDSAAIQYYDDEETAARQSRRWR